MLKQCKTKHFLTMKFIDQAKAVEERFNCAECSVSFLYKITLEKHIDNVHGSSSGHIKCTQCEAMCTTKKSLKLHSMQIHGIYKAPNRGKEGGTCEACGKYVNKFLVDHMRQSHTVPEKACDQCDFRTTMTGNLKRHIKVNHEDFEKCEPCPHCGRTIKYLEYHLKRTNCGRKPEDMIPTSACAQCGKVLVSKDKMARHVKQMHNQIRDKQCHVCDYNTYSGGNLRLHIKKQHKESSLTISDHLKM